MSTGASTNTSSNPAGQTPASDPLRLGEQLCFPLYALARLVVQQYTPLLKKIGLTYPQYLVMMILWEEGEATVQHIGERLFLDSGTLSPLLRKLEVAELIERTPAPDDERRVINRITTKGRDLKAAASPIPIELFCKSGLTPTQASQLRHLLWNLLHFMSTTMNIADQSPEQGESQHVRQEQLDQVFQQLWLSSHLHELGLNS